MASGHCPAGTSVQRVERVAPKQQKIFERGAIQRTENGSNRGLAHRTRGMPPVGTRSKRLDG